MTTTVDAFQSFSSHQYLNLETFRKNGAGVKTPVWFVQEGDAIFVRTIANSGKVKRIRNNGRVNIAPCKVDGALSGGWQPAQAAEMGDAATSRKVDSLFGKKYGIMKTLFALSSRLQGQKYTVIKIDDRIRNEPGTSFYQEQEEKG